MRNDFTFFVNNFLRPMRLLSLVTYLNLMWPVFIFVSTVGAFSDYNSANFTNIHILDFIKNSAEVNLQGFVALLVTGGFWMFALDVARGNLNRSCMYTVPVSKYQWLRWNAWLLAVSCGIILVYLSLNLSLFALPLLLGACYTVAEAMRRCIGFFKGRLGNFVTWVLPVIALPYLEKMALAMPVVAICVGAIACLLIPYALADISYRAWRSRYVSNRNEIAGFVNLKFDGSHLKWSRFDKKKRVVYFPNSSNSYKQTISNMLFPFSGLGSWNSKPILKMTGWRVLAGLASMAVALIFTEVHTNASGQMLMYPLFPILFVSVSLTASRFLIMHYQMLGRRESARTLVSVFQNLTANIAISTLIILVVFEFVLALFFNQTLSWTSLLSVAVKMLALFATLPLVFAFILDKNPGPPVLLRIRTISILVGWGVALIGISTFVDRFSNFEITWVLYLSAALAVFTITSPYLLNKYMKRYFRIQNLIRR